jgi:hypothetical protein
MALFFDYRPKRQPTRDALRRALAREPPAPEALDTEADTMAQVVTDQTSGGVQPKISSFVTAAILLAVLAVAALLAERASLEKAPDQLWTAFQTVLGVIVGFLGGEAAGMAMSPKE